MKHRFCLLVLAAAAFAAGCASSPQPYHYLENWLIRDDPVRPFTTHADLIYLQGELYEDMHKVPSMNLHAKAEVGNGRLNGVARVFSPLVATPKDIEQALDWYFRHYHSKGRLFVFVGEGAGGKLLKDYEAAHADDLKKQGLVASYYTDSSEAGFVTDAMIHEIKNEVMKARYYQQWGREMPEGMLEK